MNTSINTIIIDDEQNSRDTLRMMLQAVCPQVTITGEAKNIIQGRQLIEALSPALVFLDIQMPGGTGFDLLHSLGEVNFQVIFTTAFSEYAVQAFRCSALDYLLKPIHPEELRQAVAKVSTDPSRYLQQQLELLRAYLPPPAQALPPANQPAANTLPRKIALPTHEGIHFIAVDEIIWCEALGSYTKFHIRNAAPIVVSRLIKEYEDLFAAHHFIRVHNSSLVNTAHVVKYVKSDGGQVWMSDGSEIEVSRRRRDELLAALSSLHLSSPRM